MFSVVIGQSIPSGTNFSLTLSVSGLTASTMFSVTVESKQLCVCVCVWGGGGGGCGFGCVSVCVSVCV